MFYYRKYFFILSAVILATITLANYSAYKSINILFLFICLISLIKYRDFLLFAYVALIATNGFISTEYNLLGIFHPTYTICLFAFLAVIIEHNYLSKYDGQIFDEKNNITTIAQTLVIFIFVYLSMTDIRQTLAGIKEIGTFLLFTRTIRNFFLFATLYYLIKLTVFEKYIQIIKSGFVFSLLLISLSILLSDTLSSLGIATQDIYKLENIAFAGEYVRKAGIWGLSGDENTVAGFLAVGFAFILFNTKNYFNLYGITIILLIIALFVAGSRAAIISALFVFLFYLIVSKQRIKNKFVFLLILSVTFLIIIRLNLLDPIIERFQLLQYGQDAIHLDTKYEMGRVGGWIFYLNYIFSNINVLLFGTTETIYQQLNWGISVTRVAHNYFIQLWYYWGIFPFLFLLFLLMKYIYYSLKSTMKYAYIAIFIPFFLTLFFVSDTGVFLAFTSTVSIIPLSNSDA